MTSVSRVKEWRQIQRDAQREIGNRTYAIHRQPWRLCRNRRLRGEIRAIMAVVDPEYASWPSWPPEHDTPATAEQPDPGTSRP